MMTETAAASAPDATPIVAMSGISIAFPGVKALDGVDFRLFPGEVHALMGENGAGKSTLIKALTGVYTIDSGRILVGGQERTFAGPAQAQAAGISTVYQEVNLCDNLSVAENIMLGHEVRRAGVVDWRRTRAAARTHLRTMNLDIDPKSSLSAHSLAVQQLVAIARAISTDVKVLILDEPTSSLDPTSEALIRAALERLMHDRTVLVVAHRLNTIYTADRIAVLENGRLVETGSHVALLERGGLYARLVDAGRRAPL
jgi:galactofuranose transport system ATP-binding protein